MKTKTQFMNRILSLVLSIMMVISMLPASALSVFAADGTPVAKVGEVEYTDFATAVENWTDNTTLTLLADVTDLAEQIELSGNGLVLDLNGKKLEATVDHAIKISAGELTIRDSVGTGSFTTTQSGGLWVFGGNVNFESGTLESVTISKGTFNMTGGTIQTEAFTGIYVNGEGTANISGGEINVTDDNRMGVYNGFGTLNLSGNVVITSTYGYAFQNSDASVLTTISGDVALNGSTGELYLGKAIVLNTQPTGDTTWRVSINTGNNSSIENGVFAIPGDGVTLDPAKFTSPMDGYEVKRNSNNELVLCNHSTATVAVSNGNGTHNTTCDCNGTTFESNIACSGGVATANHLAVCAYCGGTYGELDANVNYDIIATAMTAAELKDAVAAWLADGNTDISILLVAYADEEMFTAVKTALAESSVADGSINLTLAGVKTIPDEALSDYPISIGGNKLKTLTLTDAETTGENEPFARCTYLESVSLPNATTIGAWAFNECSNLTSVYCPKVTVIGGYAFRKCAKLTTFDFTNITTIGNGAFSGCGFNTIVLPEATSIGGSAFVDNPNLISFSAPKATSFGWYPWGAETIETSKLESLELTAAGEFTIENNFSAYTPFEQINLVLNIDKKDQVTQKDDGTATWTYPYTNSSTGTETKTFKSITLTCVDGTTNHTYQYTDMSNGTHKAECTVEGCGFYKYEAHTPDAEGYTDNGDGTHDKACTECGCVVENEVHTLTYTVDGNTITVSCSANCGHTGTATISTTGKTYDGTAVEVIVSKTGSLENTVIPVTLTKDGEAFTGEPVNAGAYTASVTLGNKTVSVNFTIAKADYNMMGAKWNYREPFKYDGKEHKVEVVGLPTGVTVESYENNTATAVGDYYAEVNLTYDAHNYNAPTMSKLGWTIYNDWSPTEYTATTPNGNGWLNSDFVIAANDGYKVALTNTADGDWKDALTYSAETADGSVTIYLKNETDGTISLAKTVSYKIDKTVPVGKVEFAERTGWEGFVNTITFGLLYNDEVTIQATANDNLSGVDKIEYASADKAMTLDEVKAITDWTEYTNSYGVTLEDAKKFVYFVRITDKAGNATYLSTDGAEYDTTAPVILGIKNGKTYYTTQKVTVTDKNIDSITLNGETAGNEITLDGNKEATYTIVATDKAGNSTTVTVTMKRIKELAKATENLGNDNVTSADAPALNELVEKMSELIADPDTSDDGEKETLEQHKTIAESLLETIEAAAEATDTENTEKVENVTPENVTPENKTDLEGAKADLEKALEDNGGNYTEDEKKAIEDEIKRIDDALEVIGNVEAVAEVIYKLPAVDTVKPDDEEAIKAITDAQTAYNALSDYEKSLVDEATKAALDKLAAALVAYDIVEGDDSSWTEDSDHNITFVVNGLFSKFVGIKVDGKDVDKANYEVKAGSTIITLKASYLDTLAVGEHTISVVYTDGSTDGAFNVHAKANSPATGDNSHMFLWIALLFISGGAVITLTVVDRKKRVATKR